MMSYRLEMMTLALGLTLAGGCDGGEETSGEPTTTQNDTEMSGSSSSTGDGSGVVTTDDSTTDDSTTDASTTGMGSDASTSEVSTGSGSSESGAEEESSSTGGAADNVVWSDVDITAGCFLFVDPDTLGTSASWEDADGQVTVVFDALETIDFEGMIDGEGLTLHTEDSDTFAGDTWVFTQNVEGTIADGHFTGTWSYSECNMTQAPDSCPADGGCSGTATVDITLP